MGNEGGAIASGGADRSGGEGGRGIPLPTAGPAVIVVAGAGTVSLTGTVVTSVISVDRAGSAGADELSRTAATAAPAATSTQTLPTTSTRRLLPPIGHLRRGFPGDISMTSPSSGPDPSMPT